MATDLERLVVSLDADIKKFDSSLKKAVATFNGETKKVEKRAKDMQRNVNSSFSDLGKGLAIGAAASGATAGIMAFKNLADGATRTQNALKVAGLSGQQLTDTYNKLFKAAQDNATPIEELASLYGKASLSQKDLGASSEQMIRFTTNVAKALRVQGGSVESARGALLQLSQALSGGFVRAEEFNSIQEGALPILQAVAAGISSTGGSVANLRKLMLEGKLTSKEFFDGFERGAPLLDEKLKNSVFTIEQAMVKLNNALQNTVGTLDRTIGISESVIEVIGRLSTTVDSLGKIFTRVADSDASTFLSKMTEVADFLTDALPGVGDLKRLPGNIQDLGNLVDVDPVERAADRVEDASERIAQALETSIPKRLITADQQSQIDDLVKGLREGTVNAEDVENVLFGMGSKFDSLRGQLRPFIDILKEMNEQFEMLDEVTITAPRSTPSEGALQAQNDARSTALLGERLIQSKQSEAEKQIEARAKEIADAMAKAGITISTAAATSAARTEIATEQGVKTFEGAISGYVDRVISVESGGNTNAKNPDSTATGLGQFIESTWLDLFRRYYPAEAANMSNSAILALRTDATKSKALIEAYARENAAVLQKAGVSVDEAALQLSHFLGARDAAKVLSAAPGTPLAGLITPASIAANPTILGGGRTVDDAIAYAQKRAGQTTAGTKVLDSRESFTENIAEQQKMLQQLKEESGLRATLNPLINDYGLKLTELEKAQELFNMAQKEGTAAGKELTSATQLLNGDLSKLTPEARAQAEAMRALATQYGQTTAAANQLQASQEAAAKSSTESLELAKSVTGGLLSDIRSALSDGKITWKEWGEIAVNALNKVADKLQEMLLNQLFSPSGGLGGIFGSLFGGTGGFNPAGKVGLFADGGYTGSGGKNQPAGIVHKGEYVMDAETVRRLGVGQLDALRGYANGGLVGRMPRLPNMAGDGANEVHVYVDDEGGLRAYVQREGRKTEARVARTTKGTFDQYRSNDLRNDIKDYTTSPRRRG